MSKQDTRDKECWFCTHGDENCPVCRSVSSGEAERLAAELENRLRRCSPVHDLVVKREWVEEAATLLRQMAYELGQLKADLIVRDKDFRAEQKRAEQAEAVLARLRVQAAPSSGEKERQMRYYQIQATITVHDDEGYAITRQVPTFHLDSIIHGLRNAEVASSFAKKMLMEISGGEEIHINSVIEVPVWA